ncbi:pol [Symbiodinium sp. CCMP2456]|nr:pol [Symbiodinium sp. CCMP2456]
MRVETEQCPDDVETQIVARSRSRSRSGRRACLVQADGPDAEGCPGSIPESPVVPGSPPELYARPTVVEDSGGEVVQAECESGQGGFRALQFSDYEQLYGRWTRGGLADSEIRDIGGEELLDLMEAQKALDQGPGENTQQLLGRGTSAAPSSSEDQVTFVPTSTTTTTGLQGVDTLSEGSMGMAEGYVSMEQFEDLVAMNMGDLVERALEGVSTDEE